ncbi:MAG: hypothetical protein NVS4B1_33490 [Ktedonobacteraceae bacterium]
MDMVSPVEWDEEAQDNAIRQARTLTSRDPEAASLLVAHVIAEQEMQEQRGTLVSRVPVGYDPGALYDYMCHENGWRPQDINDMHYLTFFMMVRKANERNKREQDAVNNAKK